MNVYMAALPLVFAEALAYIAFSACLGLTLGVARANLTWTSELMPIKQSLADLAEQHSAAQDPVLLYAVETAIQLHIAGLTESLRKLYVTAYTLPSTSAYLYRSTAKRLEGIFGDYLPDAEAKDFYEMEIASAGMMRSFMAVPCDVYFTVGAQDRTLFGVRAQALQCAARAAAGGQRGRFAARPARHGGGHHPNDRPAGRKRASRP